MNLGADLVVGWRLGLIFVNQVCGTYPKRTFHTIFSGSASARLAHADGIFSGAGVHGFEDGAFLGVFGQDECGPGRFVTRWESVFVFENAADLHLDASIVRAKNIGGDFQASILQDAFLDTGHGDRFGHAFVHQDECGLVFHVEPISHFGGVGGFGFTSTDGEA